MNKQNGKSKVKVKNINVDGDSEICIGKKKWVPESLVFFNQNMKALKKHYPELADLVAKTSDNNRFEWLRTGTKTLPNLRQKQTELLYYEEENPISDTKKQIEALKLKNARLALFLGMGLGYELLCYMENEAVKQQTSYILVIEKDIEIFKAALKSVNLVSIFSNPGIEFIVGEDESQIYPKLRAYLQENSRFMFLKAMKPVYHPSSLKFHREYYLRVLHAFRDAATHQLLHYGNDPYDSLLGIENMLANLNVIISNPGIKLLYDKFKDKPAIVVSTGPSLNKNKYLLKGLEDKALIIAADASLKILMDMGVKPHLVTSLERVRETTNLVSGYSSEEVSNVYFAACPVIFNETYEAYPGPKIIVYRNFDHFKWLDIDKGILDIKLSAGNMAFKLGEALGCNPIILIGQDLAFGPDGHTHATGSVNSKDGVDSTVFRDGGNMMEIMGNNGEILRTNAVWYSFLKAYEMDVAGYSGTCINSTEGGAFIQGTQIMPFEESIDRYIKEKFDPLDIIKEALAKFSLQEVASDFLKTGELIDTTATDMQQIIANCKEGIEVCEQYRQELQDSLRKPEKLEKLKESLKQIESRIMQSKINCQKMRQTYQLFFAHVFQSFAINHEVENIAIPKKYDDINLARVEILLRQSEWYAVIGDLAGICLNSLMQAKRNLQRSEDNV